MRARYYSPEMRRFVNADIVAGQISNAVTMNRFAYANGNPAVKGFTDLNFNRTLKAIIFYTLDYYRLAELIINILSILL